MHCLPSLYFYSFRTLKSQLHIWIYGTLVLSFLSFKWIENSTALPSFFSHYFEDLLAMPIFLKTALLFIQNFQKKWREHTILKRDILIITTLTGIYFEWILPRFDERFTNDPLDFIAYAIGSGGFLLFLNQPLKLNLRLKSDRE
jgi:hypothetical protein